MKFEELPYYEQLHILVTRMRTAYWEGRKYKSASAFKKADDLGKQIDKINRAENLKRRECQKQT
jgi:hypothetical protein